MVSLVQCSTLYQLPLSSNTLLFSLSCLSLPLFLFLSFSLSSSLTLALSFSLSYVSPPSCLQCDPSEATWQLISAIVLREDKQDPRIMFLGGGCSLATEPLAALAGRFYKISMVRTRKTYYECTLVFTSLFTMIRFSKSPHLHVGLSI